MSASISQRVEVVVSLGMNVKYYRKVKGLTQKDLATAVGVSHPRISVIEQGGGNPTLKTIEAIADALDVCTEKLIREPTKKILNSVA